VALDTGSEWANWVIPSLLLREGKINEARDAVKNVPTAARYRPELMEAVLGLRPASELDQLAEKATARTPEGDPETEYIDASLFAFAGKKDAARHMIRIAIGQNFCALPALESDPLLSKLRPTPEFGSLLKAARSCQQPLLAQTSQGQ
jgi:hypothetical protein